MFRVGKVAGSLVREAQGPKRQEENVVECADVSIKETGIRQECAGDKDE